MNDQNPASDEGATKPTAAQQATSVLGGVGASAAVSAVQGAAVGGAAGAAVGAAKGAATAAATNPVVMRAVIFAVLAVVLLAVAIVAGITAGAVTLVGAVAGTEQQNSAYAVSDDTIDSQTVTNGSAIAENTGLPQELTIAILDKHPGFDFTELSHTLDRNDPTRDARNMLTGAVADSGQVGRYIPEDGELATAADTVRELYTTAMTTAGLSEKDSTSAYDIALNWALGETADPDQQSCVPVSIPDGGPGIEIDGENFTAKQVSNMKVLIGIAKTMFGEDAEQAAKIGLVTARVESRFQNYANDGEVGPEDFNMGSATAADYAMLAYSLSLPHDAIGTDHSSLGIMQQQALAGWGDHGASTWASDPEGVIGRLMNPSHAAAKFYVRLDGIDGWQGMEPGVAAQTVQVSAFPDAYAEHVGLADAAWALFGEASPALNLPDSAGWGAVLPEDPGGEAQPPSTSPCGGAPAPLLGDYGWPVGELADGTMNGYISSPYGWRVHPSGYVHFHSGVDLVAAAGGSSPIYAAGDGVVTQSKTWIDPSCEGYVEILHEDGTGTGYLHLESRTVSVGDIVTAGTQVGTEGGVHPGGCSFGHHVHMYAYDTDHQRYDFLEWADAHGLKRDED